jgi:hypothetical protein
MLGRNNDGAGFRADLDDRPVCPVPLDSMARKRIIPSVAQTTQGAFMHQRLGVVMAVFAGFASAQAAVAPSANTLAECRLEYSVAQGELKKLKFTKQTNHSDEYSYDVRTEYDASQIQPFGLKATRIAFTDYDDPDGQFRSLETDFALPYDKAKPKLLKAFSVKECGRRANPDSQFCKLFVKNDGGIRSVAATLTALKTGGSRFDCTYYD